jgi:hypothetical protein
MKKVDLSNITAGVRQLLAQKATFEHIQESFTEIVGELIKGLTDNAAGVIVLYGCQNSETAPEFDVSAGAVYYNGEIFEVPAFAGTAGGGQTAVLSVVTTYRAGDPVIYTDNNSFNTHGIRKMGWSLAAPGSAVVDFDDLVSFGKKVYQKLVGDPIIRTKVFEIGDWNMDSSPTKTVGHSLDAAKIRSVFVTIRNDTGDTLPFNGLLFNPVNSLSSNQWEIWFPVTTVGWNSTNIVLSRMDGSFMDGAAYDSIGYNRGWVTIQYQE